MKTTDSPPRRSREFPDAAALQRYCLIAAILFFVLMSLIGSIPGKAEALSNATHDKFLHVTAYSVLSVLLYAGVGGSRLQRTLGTLTGVAILGLIDETIQHFLPYRNSEAWDWLFNMMAAALSASLCSMLHSILRKRRSPIPFDEAIRRNTNRTN